MELAITDKNGQHHKYAMLQYNFDGPEIEIKVKPHVNSLSGRPFFHTSDSTKSHLQEVATTQKPKEALNTLMLEKGGEIYARNVASLPCDSRQISYAHEKKHIKDPNTLYSVIIIIILLMYRIQKKSIVIHEIILHI